MKKLVCFVVLFGIVGFVAFAQYLVKFEYAGTGNTAQFNKIASLVPSEMAAKGYTLSPVGKIPNEVTQIIHNALTSYTLDIGDIFLASIFFRNTQYEGPEK